MNVSKLAIPLAALTGLGAGAATAADLWSLDNPGFYAGVGIGVDRVQGDEFPNQNDDVDANNTTYKVPFGFRFNRMFAAEGQYINFGTADSDAGRNEVEADGLTTSVVGTLPLTERLHPYAKAGALFWNSERTFPAGHPSSQAERDGDGTDFTWGVGLKVPMTQRFDFRVEYERFEFGDYDDVTTHVDGVDVDMASASVLFNF